MGQRKRAAKPHSLYIKNPMAHRLAKQISQKTGVTLTEAVIQALQEQVSKINAPVNRAIVDGISRQITVLPVLDDRTPDEILAYGESGIPE